MFILDYKTCGTWAIRTHKMAIQEGKPSKLPYTKNRAQISRYVGLFEHVFAHEFKKGGRFEGCIVAGSILAYISRETAKEKAFVYLPASAKSKRRGLKLAKKDDRDFVVMKEAVEKRSKPLFLKLIDTKPCQTKDQYESEYYDTYDPCPLASKCFNCNKLRSTVLSALKERKNG